MLNFKLFSYCLILVLINLGSSQYNAVKKWTCDFRKSLCDFSLVLSAKRSTEGVIPFRMASGHMIGGVRAPEFMRNTDLCFHVGYRVKPLENSTDKMELLLMFYLKKDEKWLTYDLIKHRKYFYTGGKTIFCRHF